MWKLLFWLLCQLLTFTLIASSDDLAKRVKSHLMVNDPASACDEAVYALEKFPSSQLLWRVYIESLARCGKEKEMVKLWKDYIKVFPDEQMNRDLLEVMAWGTIEQGAKSTSPMMRLIALLAAQTSHDVKGVALLEKNLEDRNTLLRGVAIQLSSKIPDQDLSDAIYQRLLYEKNWNVRIEAIKAVGTMRIKRAKENLLSIVEHPKVRMEEKSAAIHSLLQLYDRVDREQLHVLTQSSRKGLRILACQIIRTFEMEDDYDLILPLARDYRPEVRAEALQALGILRVPHTKELAIEMLNDPEPTVAISAAWLLTLHEPIRGQRELQEWIDYRDDKVRRMAAAALATTGQYGLSAMQDSFLNSKDSYVKINLAMGLIAQRNMCDESCDALVQALGTNKSKWMMEENGIFKAVAPSQVRHHPLIPRYPQVVDQITRLEMINLLAVMQHPKAQESVKQFLQENTWGITGFATSLLLTEGDDEALDIVTQLLDDQDYQVRVQAALVLALWGRNERAIQTLEESYPKADRELKEKILEGIGHVGEMSSVPFLMQAMEEPFQTLRLIAASSILQCLYH